MSDNLRALWILKSTPTISYIPGQSGAGTTIMSGNIKIVRVLIRESTLSYIYGQSCNISAVLLLFEIRRETRPSHCKHGVYPLLQARARARIDEDEANAAGMSGAGVVVVWLRARTQNFIM